MRYSLLLFLLISCRSPLEAKPMNSHAPPIATKPDNSKELDGLNSQIKSLNDQKEGRESRQDFWHSSSVVLAFVAAALGVIAGLAQHFESRQSYAIRSIERNLVDAKARAASLRKLDSDWDINAARLGAAYAIQSAESEKLKREELEAKIAPRRLSLAQQRSIGEACIGITGKPITLISYALDAEGAGLGTQIASLLHLVGNDVRPNLSSITSYGGFQTGVIVNSASGDSATFAKCFAHALHDIGNLDVTLNGENLSRSTRPSQPPEFSMGAMTLGTTNANQEYVQILVGIKPIETVQ
jgi:hypothetical protein